MNLILGAIVFFWALVGLAVLGFMVFNVFTKGHRPLQTFPIVAAIGISFVFSIGSLYYNATIVLQSIPGINASSIQSNSSKSTGLYH